MHLPDLAEDHAGMVGQRFSGLCRGGATPAAFQQGDFAERLHIAQALACSSQRKPDISRPMGDAAGIDDGQEQAKVGQIETHIARIDYFVPSDQPKAGSGTSALS